MSSAEDGKGCHKSIPVAAVLEKEVVQRRVGSKLVEWVISRRERISPEDGS
jgi:hypothetical protein